MSTNKELRQQLEELLPILKIRKKMGKVELKRLIIEAGGDVIEKLPPLVP